MTTMHVNVTITLTLPNHTSMLTGRGAADVDGVGQGHRQTVIPHRWYPSSEYYGEHMASVFDIAQTMVYALVYTLIRPNLTSSRLELRERGYGISDAIELGNPTGQEVNLGGMVLGF